MGKHTHTHTTPIETLPSREDLGNHLCLMTKFVCIYWEVIELSLALRSIAMLRGPPQCGHKLRCPHFRGALIHSELVPTKVS